MYQRVDRAPAPSSTHSDVRPGGMLRARPWLWALAFALAVGQLVLLGVFLTWGLGDTDGWGSNLLLSAAAVCPLVAAAILTRHPGHTVGRVLFGIVLLSTLQGVLAAYADRGMDNPGSHLAAWVGDWCFTPGFERAEELGGSCVVAPIAPHGTCVRAALPLAAP